jgi:hypothetical protein
MKRAPGGINPCPSKRKVFGIGALALTAALATLALAGADAAPREGLDQTRLLLRLSDLPYGYVISKGDEGAEELLVCPRLTPREFADTSPRLKRFLDRFHPHFCVTGYERLFTLPGTAPGPAFVLSAAMALGSNRGANAAWSVAPELLEALFGNDLHLREFESGVGVGDASKLFHVKSRRFHYLSGRVSNVLWRSGSTLAMLAAIGPRLGENDRQTPTLARLQQARIERPTPYTLAERFDGEVPLDDPALKQPVYWLGKDFSPAGLPTTRFRGVETTEISRSRERAGKAMLLEYEEPRYAGPSIYEWNPHQWVAFQRSELSHVIVSWKCTQTRTIQLPEGTATIYGGYRRDYADCPSEAPTTFTARVALPGAFVAIEPPVCAHPCASPNAPYGSFEGMEAVVRALTLRPKRFS